MYRPRGSTASSPVRPSLGGGPARRAGGRGVKTYGAGHAGRTASHARRASTASGMTGCWYLPPSFLRTLWVPPLPPLLLTQHSRGTLREGREATPGPLVVG